MKINKEYRTDERNISFREYTREVKKYEYGKIDICNFRI